MEYDEFDFKKAMNRAIWVLIVCAIVLAVATVFGGCTTTKYIEVERIRNDTTYITKWQKDSVWLHDSILIKDRGDTVLIEKWHTKYIEKQVHDTISVAKTDSVPVPYPVPEYVEKELSWWQRTQMYAGDVMLIVLLVLLGYGVFRLRR